MTSAPPLVSAVIDNYNYGRFLPDAIRSVLSQDYPRERVEVIVVDDGSTDDSRRAIESFGSAVRPLWRGHAGQAAALNAGVRAAAGEIVCLLDSDDWWHPDKISRVVRRFSRDAGLALVQHWCQAVDAVGRPLPGAFPDAPEVYRLEDMLDGRTCFTGTSGLSFRRSALRAVGDIPEALVFCADEYLYTHVLFEGSAATIPEPLAFRRVHGRNFYAVMLHDPEKLARRLETRTVLREALGRRLRERGAALSPQAQRRQRAEESVEELLLHRYCREWKDAFRCWTDAMAVHSGSYALFKRITLALALASPGLYLFFYELYSSHPRLARWRKRLLK